MKEEAAPPRLLAIGALKAFWSRKLPLLWIVAPRPVETVLLAVLVQLVVPARLSVRALIEREALPERASAPWKVVEPVPLSVPAAQLLSPVTVSDPVPPRVPLLMLRLAVLALPPALKVPPLRPRPPFRIRVPLELTVPPLTSTWPVPGPATLLLSAWVPVEKFSVAPLATLKLPPLWSLPPDSVRVPALTSMRPVLTRPMAIEVVPAPDLT